MNELKVSYYFEYADEAVDFAGPEEAEKFVYGEVMKGIREVVKATLEKNPGYEWVTPYQYKITHTPSVGGFINNVFAIETKLTEKKNVD